jgi:hypothetical protein
MEKKTRSPFTYVGFGFLCVILTTSHAFGVNSETLLTGCIQRKEDIQCFIIRGSFKYFIIILLINIKQFMIQWNPLLWSKVYCKYFVRVLSLFSCYIAVFRHNSAAKISFVSPYWVFQRNTFLTVYLKMFMHCLT